jgi:hypothetical protein
MKKLHALFDDDEDAEPKARFVPERIKRNGKNTNVAREVDLVEETPQ